VIQAIAVNKRVRTSFCVRTASDRSNANGQHIEAAGLEKAADLARSARAGR
jgi:hypothetical protein